MRQLEYKINKHQMKKLLFTISLLKTFTSFATNYFVSPTGSNSNNGLTTATAFQTLQYAANLTVPGDTVFAMNGTYTNSNSASNILNIYNSGTASQWIVYKNYLGHNPQIKLNANNWAGIQVQGADYIIIDGFSVIGNNDSITLSYAQSQQANTNNPATSGNGIGCAPEYENPSNKSHHLIIRNCTVSKCGGGGIYTIRADYLTIENNTISECAWYSPYGNSGISLYQNWNSDSSTAIKNFVIRNTCYRNEEYIPFISAGSITDGNGIIIDDSRNTQNGSTLGVYMGRTYVANNLVFDNGGRGIHCYSSDNVIVVNNTCFKNCQSPSVLDGEYTAYEADNVSFINNIAFPDVNIPPINISSATTTNLTVDHNLWAENSGLANPFGTNTITSAPNFILPTSNPILADFHLQSSSTAINAGTKNFAPNTDKDGNIRPALDSVDIGCYEFQTITGLEKVNVNYFSFYPNPNEGVFTVSQNNTTKVDIEIYNIIGELIYKGKLLNQISEIDLSKEKKGIYFVRISENNRNIMNNKIVVQ
jgi:parallel beta-helix repeat protein